VAKNRKKYYVVWKGRQTGVFSNWEECRAQIDGFSGAEFKSFDTRELADQAFCRDYEEYRGKVPRQSALTPEQLCEIEEESYCVDASCLGSPGVLEYRGVYTKTGEEIFRQGPFANGTNNIGEFLGIVHALALLAQKGSTAPIYTDSEVAMGWVWDKKCNTTLLRSAENGQLFRLIRRAEEWLRTHEYENELLKWKTEAWGEVLADFGRK